MVPGRNTDCHLLTTGTPFLLFPQLQDTRDLPSCPILQDWLGKEQPQCPLASLQAKGGSPAAGIRPFPVSPLAGGAFQALYIADPRAVARIPAIPVP